MDASDAAVPEFDNLPQRKVVHYGERIYLLVVVRLEGSDRVRVQDLEDELEIDARFFLRFDPATGPEAVASPRRTVTSPSLEDVADLIDARRRSARRRQSIEQSGGMWESQPKNPRPSQGPGTPRGNVVAGAEAHPSEVSGRVMVGPAPRLVARPCGTLVARVPCVMVPREAVEGRRISLVVGVRRRGAPFGHGGDVFEPLIAQRVVPVAPLVFYASTDIVVLRAVHSSAEVMRLPGGGADVLVNLRVSSTAVEIRAASLAENSKVHDAERVLSVSTHETFSVELLATLPVSFPRGGALTMLLRLRPRKNPLLLSGTLRSSLVVEWAHTSDCPVRLVVPFSWDLPRRSPASVSLAAPRLIPRLARLFSVRVTVRNNWDRAVEYRVVVPAPELPGSEHPALVDALNTSRDELDLDDSLARSPRRRSMELSQDDSPDSTHKRSSVMLAAGTLSRAIAADSAELPSLRREWRVKRRGRTASRAATPGAAAAAAAASSAALESVPVICLNRLVGIGPVSPGASLSAQIHFIASRPGVFLLRGLSVVDISTGRRLVRNDSIFEVFIQEG